MKKVFFPLLLLSLLGNITTTTSSSLATTEASTTETTTITTDSLLDTSLIEESLAESSTSESTQVSSSENVTGESGSEESSTGESSESTVEKPKMQSLATTASLDLATQDGSEGNPYLVATFAELQNAVKQAIPSGSDALYIQLTADLTYNSESLTYTKNTVVNGLKDPSLDATDPDSHYAILYTGTNNTNYQVTGTGQIKLTYKNINIGNSEYPDNTFYGFVQLNSGNNTFEIENIYYNVRNGAQPFYAGASGNSIIFKGTNSFVCNGSSDGGEFSEGYETLTFDKESKTTIYSDTPGVSALLWDNPITVNVGENAYVSIESSKGRLFYGGNNSSLIVERNGFFSFEKIPPVNNKDGTKDDNDISASSDVNMEFKENSIGIFKSMYNSKPINMKTTTITASEPKYILFDFQKNTANFMAGTINLTRSQIDSATNYQLNYLNNGVFKPLVSPFLPNHTEVITTSNPSGTNQGLIYEQALSLTGVTGTPNTSLSGKQSQIEADIDGFVPNDRTLTSADYLLSRESLHGDGDINSTGVQQAINNAFNSDDSSYLRKTVTLTTENTDTSTIFENLAGGDYYLYARATGEVTEGFPSTTLWVTTASEPLSLAKVINTNIPVNMIFKSPTTEFGKAENVDEYEFINNSNIPIAVDLTEVARTAGSDSDVSLTNSLAPTDTYKLLLNLATNYTDETNNPLVWGPLTEGTIPEDSKAILLEPFWETDTNQAEVYLTGKYSGPVSEVKNVAYNFTFTINAQEETENAN